jgi:hypothetical protein
MRLLERLRPADVARVRSLWVLGAMPSKCRLARLPLAAFDCSAPGFGCPRVDTGSEFVDEFIE